MLVPLSPSAAAAATFVVAHLALGLILTPFTDKTKTKKSRKRDTETKTKTTTVKIKIMVYSRLYTWD